MDLARPDHGADPDRARRAQPRTPARYGRQAARGDSRGETRGDSGELSPPGARQSRRIRPGAGQVRDGVAADPISRRAAAGESWQAAQRSRWTPFPQPALAVDAVARDGVGVELD